jgi:hypothetical protein
MFDDKHQRLDGSAPFRRIVLGLRQLRDPVASITQGVQLAAIGERIGSSKVRSQRLTGIGF